MRGIRLAYPIETTKYVSDANHRWGGYWKDVVTDEWNRDGDYMFCNCCGAQVYTAAELKQGQPEYGIGVCRGRLNIKSNDKREITHVKTKNGWLTCWIELPREEEFDESEEW